MDADRWRRIEELFERAAALGGSEREGLLRRECGSDRELRETIERMLARDAEGGDVFDRVRPGADSRPRDSRVGMTLGSYRLTSRLGEGGMAAVYCAEREDGLFDQQVAVKVIRVECATDEAIARFEFERRTLAGLSHPNIARLFDGGTGPDGFPYLVMELIRGHPIDEFCDRRRLPVDERLRLFVTVCRAVQFAHQNLIVHRDLKPGNILVDEHGVPKLLDFGIARLLESDGLEPAEPATRTLARVLTPEYASPEQLTGGAVTTSMDVYALGVVLYDLLTGERPFRVDSRSPLEWQRSVLEETPRRPSTTASSAGSDAVEARGSSRRQLGRKLRGDLDRIVLMALRKEPGRRFQSVQELGDDVERYLAGKPVAARGDSLSYLARRFVGRNRVAVSAALAVVLALVAGLIAARRGEQRAQASERLAKEQELHARIEADSARGIARFLMESLLTSDPAPERDGARRDFERFQIERYAARIRRQHPGEAHLRANLIDTLGGIALQLGQRDLAADLTREALDIREAEFGPKSLEVALSCTSTGRVQFASGDFESARESFARALGLHRECPQGTHTDLGTAANDLAVTLRSLGRIEESWQLHLEALETRQRGGAETLPVAETLNNMAGIQMHRGEYRAAAEGLSAAHRIRCAVLGADHGRSLQTLANLSIATWGSGERERALAQMGEAIEGLRLLHLEGREDLERGLVNLSQFHQTRGEPDAAEPPLREALELQRERLGADHPETVATLQKLAVVLRRQDRFDEAAPVWSEVVERHRSGGAPPPALGRCLCEYGLFLLDRGDPAGAEQALGEALEVLRPLEAEDPVAVGRALQVLGYVLMQTGSGERAEPRLLEAIGLLERAPEAAGSDLATARKHLERLRTARSSEGD